MRLKRIQSCALGLLLVASLSACGGEGDTSTPPPATAPATSAEGLWNGTTNTGRTVAGLILDDGTFWFLYSLIGNSSVVAGVVQGNGTSHEGTFTSSNTKDFNFEGLGTLNATINGSYMMKQSMNGAILYQAGGQVTFTTTYNPQYELAPDMNTAAGTYTGSVAGNETVTAILSSAGGISGSSSAGCIFTGSFSPRAHGNVFNVTVTFGGAPCSNGTDTVHGIGFYDAGAKRLYSAALNSARTNGFLFIGTKP